MHWRTLLMSVILGLPIVGLQVSPWAGKTWWATASVSGFFLAALLVYHWKTLMGLRLRGNQAEPSQEILDQLNLINERVMHLRREVARRQINFEINWMLRYLADSRSSFGFNKNTDDCTRRLREMAVGVVAELPYSSAPEEFIQQFSERSRTIMTEAGFQAYFST